MSLELCPKGHLSAESDYCSECGARMTEGDDARVPAAPIPPETIVCPACRARQEQPDAAFCEICGCNFDSGTPAADPGVRPAPPVIDSLDSPSAGPQRRRWTAAISVDPQAHGDGSPPPPGGIAPRSISLLEESVLIGRASAARAISPEIDLGYDTAVSHRHALLHRGPEGGLMLRDIGAANGTQLNGKVIPPLQDVALTDGDTILLGHWSRIVIQAEREREP